jgi:hypothetical protein
VVQWPARHLVGQFYFILSTSFHKIVNKGIGQLGQKIVYVCGGSPGFASAALTLSLQLVQMASASCFAQRNCMKSRRAGEERSIAVQA